MSAFFDFHACLEQNHPDATVGDVLGTSKINEYKSDTLAPMLPYQVQTVISDYQELPENMRHYFVVKMYKDATEKRDSYALGTDPVVNVRIPTAKLQGKPLAMSFKPATKADEDKILAMLPTPDDNGDIDPSKLPTYIPRDVKMKAEITLGNEVLASGNSYGFGSEVITHLGYEAKQGRGTAFFGLSEKVIRTGEYHAIGYDMQGMGQKQLEHTKNTLESIKTKLEDYQANKNQAVLDGITKHELAGSILQAGVQSYFALNDVQDRIAQQQQKNIIHNRFRSYGTFHTYLHPRAVYGMILGARLDSGMQMDIDRILYQAVAKDNNSETLRNFIRSQGPRESANEHLVPEQLFDNPETAEKEVEGVSAVKALQLAAQQGQTIYTITNQNKAEVLPKLNHRSDVMTDVTNALNAGHEVTISEKQINFKGWTGSGYIIIDPNNGSGAYLISGGANGGFLNTAINIILSIQHSILAVAKAVTEVYDILISTISTMLAFSLALSGIVIKFAKCNWEYILGAIATVIIVSILSGIEIGSAGLATPAVASALLLLFSSNANSANIGGLAKYDKCSCPSGIIGNDPYPGAQCWICSKDIFPTYSSQLENARKKAEGLKGCATTRNKPKAEYTKQDFLLRAEAWGNFAAKRQQFNSCYNPQGPIHTSERLNNLRTAAKCTEFAAGLD